jgi:hypothetical protein
MFGLPQKQLIQRADDSIDEESAGHELRISSTSQDNQKLSDELEETLSNAIAKPQKLAEETVKQFIAIVQTSIGRQCMMKHLNNFRGT